MSEIGCVSRVSPVQTALRNCTRDEGGPFGFGDQELIPSYRRAYSATSEVPAMSGACPVFGDKRKELWTGFFGCS